jgi:hypothetical protein
VDEDGDTVGCGADPDDGDAAICGLDSDGDTCDDCNAGLGPDTATDGPDLDGDGLCDAGDGDDDDDGDPDGSDCEPRNPDVFSGATELGCNGIDENCNGPADDRFVDADGDSVICFSDSDDSDPFVCRDWDADTCDDCSQTGQFDPANDGPDADGDRICDAGDLDIDGDGVANEADCAPELYSVSALPPPIGNSLTFPGGDTGLLEWEPTVEGSNHQYNLYRGGFDGAGESVAAATCLTAGLLEPAAAVSQVPAAGSFLYYLVSNVNQCGESSLGQDAGGADRPNLSACAVGGTDGDGDY